MAIFGVTRNFYNKFKFIVEIDGLTYAGFQTMTEIRTQVAKIEHYEGGSLIPDKSAGRVTIPDVTLTRGATDDLDLYSWMEQVVASGAIVSEPNYKRSMDLVQQDRAGNELRRWTLVNAWPIDFKAGDWDNNADEKTMEEVILAYDYSVVGGDGGS